MMFLLTVTVSGCKITSSPQTTTANGSQEATYKIEHYFEGETGYIVDDTRTETKSGKVGQTATAKALTVSGYAFESENRNNVIRGRIKEDGSLVLKLYYSKDYTGRVEFVSTSGFDFDIIKGETAKLDVKVLVDGNEVTDGIVYSSSYKGVSIDENGLMEGKMRGASEVSVSYKNVSKVYDVSVYDAYIETEEDWWDVYEHLSYWYKLKNDIVLSENVIEHFTEKDEEGKTTFEGFYKHATFAGLLDGGNHSITYTGSRLFEWIGNAATVRNITLNAYDGFYWGSVLAYGADGLSVIENVTVNASFETLNCLRAVDKNLWITLVHDNNDPQGTYGTGGIVGFVSNASIENCIINVDLTKVDSNGHFGGVCFVAQNGAVIRGNKVISTNPNVPAVMYDEGGNIISSNTVSGLEEIEYTVEYYLDGERCDELTDTLKAFNGRTVTANIKPITGYAFDEENTSNVLTGTVLDTDALVLKVYYKESNIRLTTTNELEKEVVVGEAITLNVTVTEGENTITEGIEYLSSDTQVAIIENGIVTILKSGEVTITVSYKGASIQFKYQAVSGLIKTEEDWWNIYKAGDIIDGYYKLANDITLTRNSCEGEEYLKSYEFKGILDGQGYTINYTGNRLFLSVTGTIKNINLKAGKGYYWGTAISYFMNGATLEDVYLECEVNEPKTRYVNSAVGWIEANGAGLITVYASNLKLKNVTVLASLTGEASESYYCGVAFESNNGVFENVTINSNKNLIACLTGNTDCSNVTLNNISKTYKVEYYIEGVLNDSLTETYSALVGQDVVALKKVISEYAFDEENTNNVLEGTIPENGELVLKVYYKSAIITILTEEDFYGIYSSVDSLSGTYKLGADITLSTNPVAYFGENEYMVSREFSGTLDGDGHTLYYSGSKLFTTLTGTIRNIKLNAGDGYYWGSAVSYFMTNAKLENVEVTATFSRNNTYYFNPTVGYIEALGAGVLCVWMENTTVKNVTINIRLSGDTKTVYYNAIAYEANNSTFENILVNSYEEIAAIKNGNSDITNVSYNVIDEYSYIETEEDWWNMINGENTLSKKYKLLNDITLTKSSCDGEDYQKTIDFSGELDGQNHTISYTGNRLFLSVSGTIKNVTLNAGKGYYWGSAISYFMNGATLENVVLNTTLSEDITRYVNPAVGWITAPGAGAITVWADGITLKNVTINVELVEKATVGYYAAIAYELNNSTVEGIVVNSKSDIKAKFTGNTDTSNIAIIDKNEYILIKTEDDWWKIFTSEETLGLNYKLANDITLTYSVCNKFGDDSYQRNYTFAGLIDGDGHSITYTENKLFTTFSGTLKNITLNAGDGHYWGSSLSYFLTNATLTDVVINTTFSRNNTYWFAGGFIEAPGSGAIAVWADNNCLTNVTVNMTITGSANAVYYTGIAYELNKSTLDNVVINANVEVKAITSGDSDVSKVVINVK